MSSYELWNFTQPHSILLTLNTTGGFLCVNSWQLKCVCIVCYRDLGKCEEDKKGACMCWLFFIIFPSLFIFLCSGVWTTLLYFVYIEHQICKNAVTGELVPVILAIPSLKNIYISSTSVTQRNTIILIFKYRIFQAWHSLSFPRWKLNTRCLIQAQFWHDLPLNWKVRNCYFSNPELEFFFSLEVLVSF